MSYYHIYLVYTDKKGEQRYSLTYNLSKETVQKRVADSYTQNKPFVLAGRVYHPSLIEEIHIHESEKLFEELNLPDNKPILEQDSEYVNKCFRRRKVKGVWTRTGEFISSPPQQERGKTLTKPLGEKVFIVHGRDEKPALRLQKHLTNKLKLDAEMFEDFRERSSSNTIIEQLEYIKDNVGYAFVIVTPDDLGCLRGNIEKCRTQMLEGRRNVTAKSVREILDRFQTRARQNVVFEQGLFIGALGRDRVCCVLQRDTQQKPSDIDGILYVDFDKSVKETYAEITEKLRNIGLVA